VKLVVANPVAVSTRPSFRPAPRVSDLSGKRVGLYWNFKPGGNVALDHVERLLTQRYGGLSFYRAYGSVGASVKRVTAADADQIRANCDVVFGTTGDCGACSSWLAHDMVEFEKRGIPTVALVSTDFVSDHRRSAESFGIPELPYTVMDSPLVNLNPGQITGVIDGAIEAGIAALLSAPGEVGPDAHAVVLDREQWLSFEGSDTLAAVEEMNERFIEWQYSDGLPLLPPTRERVDTMLAGTTRDRDEVLGLMEPGYGTATIEKIAVNAVMAGCQPRHLPVLIAAMECMTDYHMDLREKAISTGPAAPFIMVNGPARQLAGLNLGICMIGPGSPSRANTAIGRALRLCMMNIGHTYPAISDMDTQGSPMKYSMCFGENEESSVWEPYHVGLGHDAAESSVTVGFFYGLNDLADYQLDKDRPQQAIRRWATAAKYVSTTASGYWLMGHRGNPAHGNIEKEHHYLVLCPQHAEVFQQAGWSKRDIQEAMYKEATQPWEFLSTRMEEPTVRAAHPELGWLWNNPQAEVAMLEDPSCFEIMVAGASGGNRNLFLWGSGAPITKLISQDDLRLHGGV
jgi:hypothetical protein